MHILPQPHDSIDTSLDDYRNSKRGVTLAIIAYSAAFLASLPFISLILLAPFSKFFKEHGIDITFYAPAYIAGIVILVIGLACARVVRERFAVVINSMMIGVTLLAMLGNGLSDYALFGWLILFLSVAFICLIVLTIMTLRRVPILLRILKDKERAPIEVVILWSHGIMLLFEIAMFTMIAAIAFTSL